MATIDMPAAPPADNINPTMVELQAMIAAFDAVDHGEYFALDSDPVAQEAGCARASAPRQALLACRPTDPAVLAAWYRWVIKDRVDVDDRPLYLHIAEQLEALAEGRSQPSGAPGPLSSTF